MDTLINDKIEGKATLINAEPEIDYAFSDWMEKLVNENMEVRNSLTHVERENDSGHIEASEKVITQEINSVSRPIEKESMANSRRDKERQGESEGDCGYKKELTLIVEPVGEDYITMMELLRGIKEKCGIVLACRVKSKNIYEITMQEGKGKTRLLDGFKIKNTRVTAKEVRSNEIVVSFLNLPSYITDAEIRQKLSTWGVRAISPIKRRKWPGTDVVDGTRFCKVQFTELVQSLPYSTKFETLDGGEYFRVIHDRQVKVCRLCIQPGHILRECPDFTCYKCKRQGHYARECDLQGGRRGEERTVDTEPAGGGERVSRSEEDQRQQDEDTGAASGGEMTPSTIGSSADGVSGETGRMTGGASGQSMEEGASTAPKTPSARASERRGGRPGEVEAPDCSEATRDGGAAAATASPKEPDDSSMEVVETRTSEEGESMDYDAVKASRKRIIKRRDKREPKEQKV